MVFTFSLLLCEIDIVTIFSMIDFSTFLSHGEIIKILIESLKTICIFSIRSKVTNFLCFRSKFKYYS